MKPSFLIVALVVTAALGAIIFVEEQRISDLSALVTELRTSLAAAREDADSVRADRLPGQATASARPADSASGADVALADSDRDPGGSQPSPALSAVDKPAGFMKEMAAMFTDPEMRKSMKAQQSMGIRMMYGDLFKKLALSPEENEQFADILAERQMDISTVAMGAMSSGDVPSEEQSRKVTDMQQRYDEQLRAVLGDENYATLQSYEKTIGERFMLQQYDGAFSAAGAPLAPGDREALLTIMEEERLRTPATVFDPSSRDPQAQIAALSDEDAVKKYVSSQAEMNARVLQRAREALTPQQVTALEKVQQQMMEMIGAQMKMSRAMFQQGK